YASVMVSGTAKAVTDADEKFRALYALAGKYLPDHLDKAERDIRASFARTAVYRLDIETMTGKAKQPRPPG
ncbi:MAG: pyridoxamine 5'-phosphate oxidase family protein, partial [Deltaproteobacteria bacterium]|nr:pyridoxamine 5'-phosphate oxidase family protein [Deltaproteobacteria bacterium]